MSNPNNQRKTNPNWGFNLAYYMKVRTWVNIRKIHASIFVYLYSFQTSFLPIYSWIVKKKKKPKIVHAHTGKAHAILSV